MEYKSTLSVAVLFARLGPYHHARLRAAGKLCNLTAIEFSKVDNTYAWEKIDGTGSFKLVTLFKDADIDKKSLRDVRCGIQNALDACDPQVVAVPGWGSKPALLALEWCRLHNIPAIVMSDSQAIDEPRTYWKERVKSWVVGQFSAGLVAGQRHVDYLARLGLEKSRIFTGYDVVDNEYFFVKAGLVRSNGLNLKVRKSLPDKYFLNSSRFIPKKNLPLLINAYTNYRKKIGAQAWHLVIIGDGLLRGKLEAQINSLGLGEHVHLPGFKQYNELPCYYGLAEAYIQASTTEQWGLAVNEAMASGLPVMVSDRCGCAPDLVEIGRNGFTFDPYDVDALSDLMLKVASDDCDREAMGKVSQEIISRWTPVTFARALVQAAEGALASPRRKAGWDDKVLLRAVSYR